ncbi:MAG: GNAT family N-acetyltransferase [Thaumarchaeota archaeon]|nr:GNAT family N-acetyltransferase [Nitrososphaerota archaeon]
MNNYGGAGGGHGTAGDTASDGITVRPLRRDDIRNGLLETLDALRPASAMSRERAERIMDAIMSDGNRLVAVAELGGKVVGTATVLFETKFIHDGGVAGHIEDVAVRQEYQKKGIGGMIVRYLLDAARERGCYKTVLDCESGLVDFYTNLGFKHASSGMRYSHKG